MTKYIIPNEWTVGIETIDQEHHELLSMLFIQQHEDTGTSSTSVEYFDGFYMRLSVLMKNKERHMEISNYYNFERKKLAHNKILERLTQLRDDQPSLLLDACTHALLREVADSELYYNNLQ